MLYNVINSVWNSGYITIDPDFNCITTSPHFRTKTYYYHYNHQGSVALVTYQNGTLQQHLQYLPYGGTFVDQQTSSYASTYTFSAKEKDAESGYTYFGARYYSDNIMQWLSVDPMSDMRPGVSPYSYCQNNPIGRVDTWGMLDSVFIHGGKAADYATEQLRQAAPNLGIQRDKESGKLSYSGPAITKAEKKIAQAIDDKNVMVNIEAGETNVCVRNGEKIGTSGGGFLGNEIQLDGSIITDQYVCPETLEKDFYGSKGQGMLHELTESYIGGKISLRRNVNAQPGSQIYEIAHRRAWPQPEYKYAIKPQVPITYEEGMDRIRKYINERQ